MLPATLRILAFISVSLLVCRARCHSRECPGDLLKKRVCKGVAQPLCGSRVTRSVQDGDCDRAEACVCPPETPLRFNDRCYKTFECPKKSADGMSDNRIGHNFVIPGKINGKNEVFGMHISALRLPPHWYHGIAQFKFINSSCADHVKRVHESNPTIFISINYRVPIKLAELLTTGKTLLATIGFGAGQLFTPITQCDLRVKKVLDLRRYKHDQPYPSCQKYLLFGDGQNAYMSHIPTRCKDTQQILMLKSVPSGITAAELASGVVARLPELDGAAPKNENGQLVDPLVKQDYLFNYKCDYRRGSDDEVEEKQDGAKDGIESDEAAAEEIGKPDEAGNDDSGTDKNYCSNLHSCKSSKLEIAVKYPLDTYIINIMCP